MPGLDRQNRCFAMRLLHSIVYDANLTLDLGYVLENTSRQSRLKKKPAPAWTTAGIYVILFRIIPILGKHTSPFPPKLCLCICFGVDITSLILQATGGGLAGQSFHKDIDTRPGTYTMVAGILFQLASTITYSVLMSIVFVRGFQGIKNSKPLMWLCGAMILAISCMIARGVYRSIELLQGWRGYLNTHEVYVIGLDGSLMIIAVVALNIFNPGRLLKQANIGNVSPALAATKEMNCDEEAKVGDF